MNSRDLCEQLVQATRDCIERARPMLKAVPRLPPIEIRCDLHGRSAGQMRRHPDGRLEIRYNLKIASLQPEEFLRETVAHEVAHLLTWLLHGPNARPHGPQWQSVMRRLGIESPRRCHDFHGGEPAHRQRRWSYRCACRTHQLSTTRHNRIRKGACYRCTTCGGALQAVTTTR